MNCLRDLWAILLPRQRRAAAGVFLLMLVGTLLETLNIGLILPALAVLTGDDSTVPRFLRPWVVAAGDAASPRAVILVLLALVGVYAVKSAYLLFAAAWSSRFARGVQADTSTRLFSVFLAQPWQYHLQTSSSAIQHAVGETQHLAMICIQAIQVMSELLVLAGLLTLLLVMEPLGTVVVAGLLGLAFWVFNGAVRPRTRAWAAARQQHARMLIEHTQQAVGGAREMKVSGSELEFLDRFRHQADGLARTASLKLLAEQLPRQVFELIALIALMLLAATMAAEGRGTRAILPMLGLFATVAFRVLPSVNHMAVAIQRLHQHEPIVSSLRRHLALERSLAPAAPTHSRPFDDHIRMEGIVYRYPDRPDPALRGVDIDIPRGAKVGIIGGSGAGKSTLVDVLLGLLPPTQGRVTVDGVDIHDDVRGWQWTIGYVPQSIYLADDTIRRNVAFGVPEHCIDDDAVRRALAAARLDDLLAGLPAGIETKAGEWGARLSGGQRQRIGIARALYHDPQLLVLDEATSALDGDTEREVMAAVDALHGAKTLVIVAHRLSTVANCDRVYRLEAGRVVKSGAFADVVPSPATVSSGG
jgi:ABC-type multidrug transport system fused ATPase/permease subunit